MFVPEFSNDGRRLTMTGSGIVLGSELIAATQGLLHEEDRVRALREVIVLLDRIDGIETGARELREIADQDETLASWSKGLRIAVVAAAPDAVALARMWQAFVAVLEWDVNILPTRRKAEAWLAKRKKNAPGGRAPRGVRKIRQA